MKNTFKIQIAIVVFCLLTSPLYVGADSDLDSLVKSLNVQAEADLGGFKVRLSTHFGVPMPRIDVLIKTVSRPADAYMCLRIVQIINQPLEVVLKEYKTNKGKGWGVIAKNLGIKPGSKEFHELKKGDFVAKSVEGKGNEKGKKKIKEKGEGKGKGHKK